VPAGAGCGLLCSNIGYENGLQLHIGPFSTPGSYRIDIEAEDDVIGLRYEVTADRSIQCGGECDLTGAHVEVRGRSFEGSPDVTLSVRTIEDDRGPKRVSVRLFRDGAQLGEDTLEPRYQTNEPNGSGCGDHVFAEAMIVVP